MIDGIEVQCIENPDKKEDDEEEEMAKKMAEAENEFEDEDDPHSETEDQVVDIKILEQSPGVVMKHVESEFANEARRYSIRKSSLVLEEIPKTSNDKVDD